MDRRAGPALRWSRALILAAVMMGSGVLGHLLADGLVPGRAAMAVLFGTCVLGSASALGSPASRLRIVVLVVAGQVLVHGSLTALTGHRGDPPLRRARGALPGFRLDRLQPPDGQRTGTYYDTAYAHSVQAPDPQLVVPAPVQHLLADLTGPHAAMAVAHLAAAAVVGLWLASGEHALWSVLVLTCGATHGLTTALCRSLRLPLGAGGPEVPPSVVAVLHEHRRRSPKPVLLLRACGRRGPPPHLLAS